MSSARSPPVVKPPSLTTSAPVQTESEHGHPGEAFDHDAFMRAQAAHGDTHKAAKEAAKAQRYSEKKKQRALAKKKEEEEEEDSTDAKDKNGEASTVDVEDAEPPKKKVKKDAKKDAKKVSKKDAKKDAERAAKVDPTAADADSTQQAEEDEAGSLDMNLADGSVERVETAVEDPHYALAAKVWEWYKRTERIDRIYSAADWAISTGEYGGSGGGGTAEIASAGQDAAPCAKTL